MVNGDGTEFVCMRVENNRPFTFTNGDIGWIHGERSKDFKRTLTVRKQPEIKINAEAMLSAALRKTTPQQISWLADELGVKASSLVELRVAWGEWTERKDGVVRKYAAYWFPMRDGTGRVVGLRTRGLDGSKWSVRGGSGGLFLPYCKPHPTAYIVEGASDTAAGLSMNLFCIGRASCNSGLFDLQASVKRLGIRRVVIIADNDTDKYRPNGEPYNPGIDGGQRLAEHLSVPCCLITLPCKDLRQAYAAGFTADDIENLTNNYQWIMPKGKI